MSRIEQDVMTEARALLVPVGANDLATVVRIRHGHTQALAREAIQRLLERGELERDPQGALSAPQTEGE